MIDHQLYLGRLYVRLLVKILSDHIRDKVKEMSLDDLIELRHSLISVIVKRVQPDPKLVARLGDVKEAYFSHPLYGILRDEEERRAMIEEDKEDYSHYGPSPLEEIAHVQRQVNKLKYYPFPKFKE